MKRKLSALLLWGISASILALSAAAQSGKASDGAGDTLPLQYLASWVGRYPGEEGKTGKPARPGRSFFEDPAVLPSLKAMLPKDALRAMVKGWKSGRVESPVTREGDIIKADFCKPHACPDENAAVFVNLRTGRVEACWYRYDDAKGTPQAFWYTPDAPPKPLDPKEDCFKEGMGLVRKYGSQ